MTKTLVEKIGETRTVERVMEVLAEKYSNTDCEKIADVMKKISGFRADGKVDLLIDNFEEMMMEVKNLRLVERLEYALSAQFVERLEEGGKINSNEKLRLKDILETRDGNLKEGDTMEEMKKELKRLKVIENREEPFTNKTRAFYTRTDDTRSC